jgi:hypothetical protein
MSTLVGPDGRPPRLEGSSWVSDDGRYRWNGVDWLPQRRRAQIPYGLIIAGLAVLAAAFVAWNYVLPILYPPPMGVTNPKIDSPTRVEFDYARDTSCEELTFRLVFYDGADNQVQVFDDSAISSVPSNKTVHFTLNISPALPSNAARFDADPACHG